MLSWALFFIVSMTAFGLLNKCFLFPCRSLILTWWQFGEFYSILFALSCHIYNNRGMKGLATELAIHHSKPKSKFSLKFISQKWYARNKIHYLNSQWRMFWEEFLRDHLSKNSPFWCFDATLFFKIGSFIFVKKFLSI